MNEEEIEAIELHHFERPVESGECFVASVEAIVDLARNEYVCAIATESWIASSLASLLRPRLSSALCHTRPFRLRSEASRRAGRAGRWVWDVRHWRVWLSKPE